MKKFFFALILFVCVIPFFMSIKPVHAQTSNILTLSSNTDQVQIDLNQYTLKTTNFGILSMARTRQKGNTIEQKIAYLSKLLDNKLDAKVALSQVFVGIENQLETFFKQNEIAPKNATMKFNPYNESFTFTKEKSGLQIKRKEAYNQIANAIIKGNCHATITPVPHHATLTEQKIKQATELRAAFSTSIENSSPERKHNIRLAAAKLNGVVLYPNQTLSFNKIVGARNEKNGYQEAKIILDGTYIDGVGGGVCQVSSTLYNAILLSGVDSVSSRGHSRPAIYVPAGLDAMVSDGSDLIIKNNLSLPIAIKATADTALTIKIFGLSLGDTHYELSTQLVKQLPKKPTEYKKDVTIKSKTIIREEQEGFVMQSYRHKMIDGKEKSVERIRKTTYDSISQIISI